MTSPREGFGGWEFVQADWTNLCDRNAMIFACLRSKATVLFCPEQYLLFEMCDTPEVLVVLIAVSLHGCSHGGTGYVKSLQSLHVVHEAFRRVSASRCGAKDSYVNVHTCLSLRYLAAAPL